MRAFQFLPVCILLACSSSSEVVADPDAEPIDGAVDDAGDASTVDGATDAPVGDAPPSDAPPAPTSGKIPLTLEADRGAAAAAVVSLGVPFPPGALASDKSLALFDAAGAEVAITTTVLAKWPADGSLRSVLVAFKTTLAAAAKATWELRYGAPRTLEATGLAANPDGPVAATLPATWLSGSRVSGVLLPVAANKKFATYDTELESQLGKIAWGTFGSNCASTTNHRTYYDSPHGMYQLYARVGDARHYRRAREEAVWYRANELRWYEGRAMAVQVCQPSGWTPSVIIDWGVLRRMLGQGMLDDYLLTGDPAAKEAVLGLGEAYRRNLPALTSGKEVTLEVTERNMAWPLMGLSAYYAIDPRKEVKDALESVVTRTVAWQARGKSGAFEHDIVRPDPSECSNGPAGGSPFMTSLLVDGLMDYHALTLDPRVVDVVKKVAAWYETKAITTDKKAFRYLWNCLSDPYDSSDYADLNLLIGHVFGAAYHLTKDPKWIAFGDTIAASGVESIYVGRPKQWNQGARAFGRYLGYRAAGAAP